MTAKEKAKELKYKFLFEETESISSKGAKLFSSIVVDEMLNNLCSINNQNGMPYYTKSLIEYWNEVKQEIEKL